MHIEHVGNGPFPEIELGGHILSVGGQIDVDLAAEQRDAQRVIDVCRSGDGALVAGAARGLAYVATIIIPAKRYREQVVTEEDEPVTDDSGNPVYERVAVGLDVAAVSVRLWSDSH